MIDSLFIAWHYVRYYRWRSATLVAAITLITVLPLALEVLLAESERQLLSRAESTPLIMGAKGSSLDLVMNGLYFDDELPEPVSMALVDEVDATGLALPIPVYARFTARKFPVIGTTLDYFEFRDMQLANGQGLAMLGECVLGASVAEQLELKPGDTLTTSPEMLFDLAGIYPLKMKVVGVMQKTHTPDDLAIFVDIKTSWVIEGLVHGHQDINAVNDKTLVMQRSDDNVVATAKLMQYTEINEDNIDSFHFHGSPDSYPLTAVIAVPHDTKSGTLLRGRYQGEENRYQAVRPKAVIDGLLENIFRIRNVLDAVILIVGVATVLALVLVFALSLRLRQREIETIYKLGCSRLTIVRLLAAEIGIILLFSLSLCAIILLITDQYSHDLVRSLIIR